jgi:hypothetical protein
MTLPFTNGTYKGRGHWIDQKATGIYTAEYSIADGEGGAKVHTVHRVFFKPDGSVAYEENSTVTFQPAEKNGVTVTIATEKGSTSGSGYFFERHVHYAMQLTPDNQLEFTFTIDAERLDGLGSATNKGNFTSWTESLTKA